MTQIHPGTLNNNRYYCVLAIFIDTLLPLEEIGSSNLAQMDPDKVNCWLSKMFSILYSFRLKGQTQRSKTVYNHFENIDIIKF